MPCMIFPELRLFDKNFPMRLANMRQSGIWGNKRATYSEMASGKRRHISAIIKVCSIKAEPTLKNSSFCAAFGISSCRCDIARTQPHSPMSAPKKARALDLVMALITIGYTGDCLIPVRETSVSIPLCIISSGVLTIDRLMRVV